MEGERGIGLLTCRGGRGQLCPVSPAAGTPACSAREAPLQLHSQGSSPGTSRKGGHTAVSARESPQSCIGTPKGLISAPLIPPLPAKPSLGASPRDNQHKRYLKASSVLGGCRSSGDSKGWSRQKPQPPWGSSPGRIPCSTPAHAAGTSGLGLNRQVSQVPARSHLRPPRRPLSPDPGQSPGPLPPRRPFLPPCPHRLRQLAAPSNCPS